MPSVSDLPEDEEADDAGQVLSFAVNGTHTASNGIRVSTKTVPLATRALSSTSLRLCTFRSSVLDSGPRTSRSSSRSRILAAFSRMEQVRSEPVFSKIVAIVAAVAGCAFVL